MADITNEKTTFGATIEPPRTPHNDNASVRDAPPSPLTTHSLPAGNPFYGHSNDTQDNHLNHDRDLKAPPTYTQDIESQRSAADLSLANTKITSHSAASTTKQHESMWPTLSSQKAKRKQEKKEKCARSWNPVVRYGMGRRQKMIVGAVVALLIIGAAVGIGVGVSIATGGSVKQANGENRPIKNGSS